MSDPYLLALLREVIASGRIPEQGWDASEWCTAAGIGSTRFGRPPTRHNTGPLDPVACTKGALQSLRNLNQVEIAPGSPSPPDQRYRPVVNEGRHQAGRWRQ